MKIGEKVLIVFIIVYFRCNLGLKNDYRCGVDNSDTKILKRVANIETYPWLGLLFYPIAYGSGQMTTTIVLITRRMALAAALDIDKYPKDDFRAMSRVLLGRDCSGPFINVIDYTFHPDFSNNRFNTLAIIQLDTQFALQEICPICPPPKDQIINTQVYAMSLTQDCSSLKVRIYKMSYVDSSECREFYRRTNLDISSLWPTYFACARAANGGKCVWQSGTVLTTRVNGQWKLLGLGVNGPGCEAPARFMDFGMYSLWVKENLAKIGTPAITRIGSNHIILRRTIDSIRRFGPCDDEETRTEIFTDYTSISYSSSMDRIDKVSYNLSLVADMDYSCVVLRVYSETTKAPLSSLRIRRWCANPLQLCDNFPFAEINFSVDIKFTSNVVYKVSAYGRKANIIVVELARKYTNKLFYGNEVPTVSVNASDVRTYEKYQQQFVAGLIPYVSGDRFIPNPGHHAYTRVNKTADD